MTSAIRLRRLIAEDAPVIVGYDQEEYARRLYYDRPIEASLDAFRAARACTVELLERLTPEQWLRAGTHSETGAYSVERWLEIYAATRTGMPIRFGGRGPRCGGVSGAPPRETRRTRARGARGARCAQCSAQECTVHDTRCGRAGCTSHREPPTPHRAHRVPTPNRGRCTVRTAHRTPNRGR